jgi:hypothetical protein
MATDVKLDEGNGNTLLLEADVVKSTGADFVMDSAARRSTEGGTRRALVHDQSDGLTINFNGDYPGGVTAHGNMTVHGNITFESWTEILVPLGGEKGTVNFHKEPVPFLVTVNLAETLIKLQDQIVDLQNKIAALEARP